MSAYNFARVAEFTEGDYNLIRVPYIYRPSSNDLVYEVKEGDRLDTIAFNHYGNSRLWYIIADANEIINPFELSLGDKLIIPGDI